MDLAGYLIDIATTYDRHAPMSSPPQLMLRQAPIHLSEHLPGGLLMLGSGGRGVPTDTPWIGIFDPDETSSPQEGVYIVYLFSTDLQSVTLSLNQGMERLRKAIGDKGARERLALDAANIRKALPPISLMGWLTEMDLGPKAGARQRAYMAANIVCRSHRFDALPAEGQLRQDLARILDLYQDAVAAKRRLLQTDPGSIASASALQVTTTADPLAHFKPKNESDYLSQITGKTLIKTRRHEKLVREYGEWASTKGFVPAMEHPRDLILRKNGEEWLIEAKVIRHGNATEAVRAALGQLFAYRFTFYKETPLTGLVALFSEPVGRLYEEFLAECGIRSVWRADGMWVGTDSAVLAMLAEAVATS